MNPRFAAWFLCFALLFAAATDYIPAFIDADGRVFGVFKLDIYKDALHVASGIWAAVAATWSRRAGTTRRPRPPRRPRRRGARPCRYPV